MTAITVEVRTKNGQSELWVGKYRVATFADPIDASYAAIQIKTALLEAGK